MASGSMAQNIFGQNPGRATLVSWTEATMHRAGGEARGGRPNAVDAPSLITIDPVDWIDPDVVDARDVRDPLMLASLVLVASHLSERCKDTGHSADCRAVLAVMGQATFDDFLQAIGIDIHATSGLTKRRNVNAEGRRT